jgi:hypothetical protein
VATYTYSLEYNSCVPDCLLTSPNCLQCSSSSQCSVCQAGFVNSSASVNVCLPLCAIPNCWRCSSSLTCISCNANYSLSSNKTQCTLACSVPNCNVCLNSTACSQCQVGYTLSNNLCIIICEFGFYNSGN